MNRKWKPKLLPGEAVLWPQQPPFRLRLKIETMPDRIQSATLTRTSSLSTSDSISTAYPPLAYRNVVARGPSLARRWAFWVVGSEGFLWAALWWFWYRNTPQEQPGISAAELNEVEAGPAAPLSHAIPWALLLRSKQLWLISTMYALYVWGSWFYFSWLHTYLIKGCGFTEMAMSSVSSILFFMGACGNIAGGFLSDSPMKRFGLRNGRRWVGSFSLASSSCLFLATALSPDKWIAIALLTAGLFVLDFLVPTAWAVCLDVGQNHAGAVTGVMSTAGQAGGFIRTVLFGYIA